MRIDVIGEMPQAGESEEIPRDMNGEAEEHGMMADGRPVVAVACQ